MPPPINARTIPNSVFQADLIAFLKAEPTIIAALSSNLNLQILEDQYSGKTMVYPGLRVDVQRQTPHGNADQCDHYIVQFTIHAYGEGGSSQATDDLMGLVVLLLQRRYFRAISNVNPAYRYRIPRIRLANMEAATRIGDRLWLASATFSGNLYPTTEGA